MAGSSSTGPTLPFDEIRPHSNNNTSPTPANPYRPYPPMMQQSRSYSVMFDKVVDARTRANSKSYDFYTDEDVIKYSPRGWPGMMAAQAFFPNRTSKRAFRVATQQLLTYYQQKIHCIDNKINEMSFEDYEAGGESLRSLPFGQEEFLGRCMQGIGHLPIQPPDSNPGELDRTSQMDNLMMCKGMYLEKYYSILHMHCENNSRFARVSRRAHEEHFNDLHTSQGLDNEALAFMRYVDDFISDAPDYIFQKFESLLYTKSPWVSNLLSRIHGLFCGKSLPSTESDDPLIVYELQPFEIFIKALLVLSSQLLLVIPVSLLYLQTGWPRFVYLIVVTICSLIFSVVMVKFEARTNYLLVGATAYYAVLVAFLANLPDHPQA